MSGREVDAELSIQWSSELRFWWSEELAENLFRFLDAFSMASFAHVHPLAAKILQEKTSSWKILVRRCCPFFALPLFSDNESWTYWIEAQLNEKKTVMRHLTTILKQMKNPKVPLLELLHVICERFPPVLDESYTRWKPSEGVEFVQLRCSCNRSPHQVSQMGFLLLEEVEGALGSAEQKVDLVDIDIGHETWMTAVNARVDRQNVMVRKVDVGEFYCENDDQVENVELGWKSLCGVIV